MAHLGVICPNALGHLNPMVALADAMRTRGHRVTFLLIGDTPTSVTEAGFEVLPLGGSVYPPDEYGDAVQHLGTVQGRPALKHTLAIGTRTAKAILEVGPALVRGAGISALVIDQASFAGGTVADQLNLPFATVCNALLLHPDPATPPFFTHWQPRDAVWAQLRNRVAWAALKRLYAPIMTQIRERRRGLGLPLPEGLADVWSGQVQISQQPEMLTFPRRKLPEHVHFVGPLRLPGGYPEVPFPWGRLDERPLIYASLGTLQNRVVGTFRAIAEACAGLDAQLVISTGNGVAPEALGELPGRPIVVPYAPQLELLSRSTVAVTHAGLNTVLDTLSCGVPLVAVPITNEQPGIAARVASVGAGEVVAGKEVAPETFRASVVRVQENPSYRAAAERVRDAIRSAGGAPRAAEIIEQSLHLGVGENGSFTTGMTSAAQSTGGAE